MATEAQISIGAWAADQILEEVMEDTEAVAEAVVDAVLASHLQYLLSLQKKAEWGLVQASTNELRSWWAGRIDLLGHLIEHLTEEVVA